MDIVIIGAGAAGISAVETIRKLDQEVPVHLISKMKYPYSLCAIPQFLAGEIKEPYLERYDNSYFRKLKVYAHFGDTVVKITPDQNLVTLQSGEEIRYDKLLIATGSRPIVPKIPGIERKGVYSVGSIEDAKEISRHAKSGREVVVIGAGFIGLECAIALKKLGLDVAVVEMLDRVLPRTLDPEIATMAEKLLKQRKIKVILNDQVQEILGNEMVTGIRLRTKTLKCDMVVVAVGVRPELTLAKEAKITTNRGVSVDNHMRTNIANIFATGDVAEAVDFLTKERTTNAIWPNAISQGRVAALNMLGINAIDEGTLPQNVVDIFGTSFASIGSLQGEKIDMHKHRTLYRFTIENRRVIGAQLVGDVSNAGLISSFIRKGTDIKDLEHLKLFFPGKLHLLAAVTFYQLFRRAPTEKER
jgi:NADPH-dependent 2,4-dienoyl-CoA reductase/sulfur reductase-like enzyme